MYLKSDKVIDRFMNDYHFLSNFYYFPFEHHGYTYKTSEHAYQAAKTDSYTDFIWIAEASTPTLAKQYGRKVKMNKLFEGSKLGIMLNILKSKFEHEEMAKLLKETGDAELIEGNTWHDNYWGNCSCGKCHYKEGQNKLGTLLMNIRAKL